MEPREEPESLSALISRINGIKFHRAWWGKGYDQREVDDFLDRTVTQLREGKHPNPSTLRNAAFTVTWLSPGYSASEVSDLLDELARYDY
jgi:DivIVA domain-containing protein